MIRIGMKQVFLEQNQFLVLRYMLEFYIGFRLLVKRLVH